MHPAKICADKIVEESKGYSLCFVFIAHLFSPDDLENGIEARLRELDIPYTKVEASEFVGKEQSLLQDNGRLLIWLRRSYFEGPERCRRLGLLGEVATAVIRQGRSIVLLSEMPALDFVDCGPSGFIDEINKNIIPKPLSLDEVRGVVSGSGRVADAESLYYLSNGLPRLVEVIGAAAISKQVEKLIEREVFAAVRQCGIELSAWMLDLIDRRSTFEFDSTRWESHLDRTCRGAGLAVRNSAGQTELLPGRIREPGLRAIRDYSDKVCEQPLTVAAIFRDLWLVERILKAAIKARAVERYGVQWRQEAIPKDAQGRCLTYAKNDGMTWARDVSDLPNPLEWLSLGDLNEISKDQTLRPERLAKRTMERIVADLTPIRNRLAHMQPPLPLDGQTVRQWTAYLMDVVGKPQLE